MDFPVIIPKMSDTNINKKCFFWAVKPIKILYAHKISSYGYRRVDRTAMKNGKRKKV